MSVLLLPVCRRGKTPTNRQQSVEICVALFSSFPAAASDRTLLLHHSADNLDSSVQGALNSSNVSVSQKLMFRRLLLRLVTPDQ